MSSEYNINMTEGVVNVQTVIMKQEPAAPASLTGERLEANQFPYCFCNVNIIVHVPHLAALLLLSSFNSVSKQRS